jgi:hypothetical protein
LLAAGCTHELPPATTPVAALPSPNPSEGTVLFVRPRHACDSSDYAIVSDDQGHFVGNVAAGTQLASHVSAGPHVFFAWSDRDLRFAKEPNFNPVAATRVEARAGETSYVLVSPRQRQGAGSRCYRYSYVTMRHVRRGDDEAETLQDWLRTTQPVVADHAEGQRLLDADPALLRANLDYGRARLARMEELTAERKAQQKAEPEAGPEK